VIERLVSSAVIEARD